MATSAVPDVQKPYNPEKLRPGAKAMTIAVGFLCDNGNNLVIAADRQFTSPGFYKSQAKKYITKEDGFMSVAFVFSGEPGTFKEFHQKVFGFLDQIDGPTTEDIRVTIEGVLDSMGLRDRSIPPSFFLLVGINELFKRPEIIVFDGRAVFIGENGVYTIGCGDTSLIRFLGDHLYAPEISPNQGLALGAYLIKKATQYVDYCGEPIDVIHGDSGGFEVVEKDKIRAGIGMIENEEQYLSTLLVQKPFSL